MADSSGSESMSSMNYKGYTARIAFSEDDGVFWGKVLGLPASTSISFEGDTVAQASGLSLNQWAAKALQQAAHR